MTSSLRTVRAAALFVLFLCAPACVLTRTAVDTVAGEVERSPGPLQATAVYLNARLLDLMDVVPISFAAGYGLSAEARVTPFLGLGLGWAENWRAGMEDHRFGPLWWEKERGIPLWRYYRYQDYLDSDLRMAGADPYWWPETRRIRANSFLVIPGMTREGNLWFPILPPYYLPVDWEWTHWGKGGSTFETYEVLWDVLNSEVGVFAGVVGVRVGVAPLHVLDFVLGFLTIDWTGDDPRAYPILWPDPAAPDSFPADRTPEQATPDPPVNPPERTPVTTVAEKPADAP